MRPRWYDLDESERRGAAAAAAYLAIAEREDPAATRGSWTAGEALEGLCAVIGVDADAVRAGMAREFFNEEVTQQ